MCSDVIYSPGTLAQWPHSIWICDNYWNGLGASVRPLRYSDSIRSRRLMFPIRPTLPTVVRTHFSPQLYLCWGCRPCTRHCLHEQSIHIYIIDLVIVCRWYKHYMCYTLTNIRIRSVWKLLQHYQQCVHGCVVAAHRTRVHHSAMWMLICGA